MKLSTGKRRLGHWPLCLALFACAVVVLVPSANGCAFESHSVARHEPRQVQGVTGDSPSPTVEASPSKSPSATRSPRSQTPSPSFSASSTPLPEGPHQIRLSDFWYHSEAGVAPDDSWLTPAFNEALWPIGRTPSGYGFSDISTKYTYGSSSKTTLLTVYLRKTVRITREAGVEYNGVLSMQVVDGVVVFMNGVELGRINMPSVESVPKPRFNTYAINDVKPAEAMVFKNLTVTDSFIRNGDNIICVELHKAGSSVKFMRFNAQLLIERPGPTPSASVSTSASPTISRTSSRSESASRSEIASPSATPSVSESGSVSVSRSFGVSRTSSRSTSRTPSASPSSLDVSSDGSIAISIELSSAESPNFSPSPASDSSLLASGIATTTPAASGLSSASASRSAGSSASSSSVSTRSPSASGSPPNSALTVSVGATIGVSPSIEASTSPTPSQSCVCGCESLSCCFNETETRENCLAAGLPGNTATSSGLSSADRAVVIGVTTGVVGAGIIAILGAFLYKKRAQRNYGAKWALSGETQPVFSQTASDGSQPQPANKAGLLSPNHEKPRKGNGLFSRFRKPQTAGSEPAKVPVTTEAPPKQTSPSETAANSEQLPTPSATQPLVKPTPQKPKMPQRFPSQIPRGLRPIPSSAVPLSVRLKVMTHGSKRYLIQQVPVSSPMAPMRGVQHLPPEALIAKYQKAQLAANGGGETRPKKNFRLRLMKIQRRRLADDSSLPKLDTVPLPIIRADNRKPAELVEFL